jgi:hypothetical protein
MPCSMDNWGEGVVPACREERPQRFVSHRFSTLSMMNFYLVSKNQGYQMSNVHFQLRQIFKHRTMLRKYNVF